MSMKLKKINPIDGTEIRVFEPRTFRNGPRKIFWNSLRDHCRAGAIAEQGMRPPSSILLDTACTITFPDDHDFAIIPIDYAFAADLEDINKCS